MPGFQSTRLVTEGALEPFFFLYTDDSIQGNPETCKQSSIMLNYEVKNTLDNQTTDNIMELFRKLNEKGMTILIITHDTNVAEKCSRCLVLQDGHLIKY